MEVGPCRTNEVCLMEVPFLIPKGNFFKAENLEKGEQHEECCGIPGSHGVLPELRAVQLLWRRWAGEPVSSCSLLPGTLRLSHHQSGWRGLVWWLPSQTLTRGKVGLTHPLGGRFGFHVPLLSPLKVRVISPKYLANSGTSQFLN